MKLYIANQNYSSWSLRGWVIFAQYNLPVEIEKLPIFTEAFYTKLAKVVPVGKVPALVDGDISVWDSLAILEYINDEYLQGKAWPVDKKTKAIARAVSAEMHSSFADLRNEMPMNCRAKRKVNLSEGAKKDIARIDQIWSERMQVNSGEWLFGDWSIADAMYAPVALRFETYGIELSQGAQLYKDKTINSPAIQKWLAEASLETDIVEEDEVGEPV